MLLGWVVHLCIAAIYVHVQNSLQRIIQNFECNLKEKTKDGVQEKLLVNSSFMLA